MYKSTCTALLLLSALTTHAGLALPSGIYAEFNTNHGTFTAQLTYTNTPTTVANFVSLAEGSRPWLNTDTGLIQQQPFFNNKIFHRIIPGFVIQGGSHNGTGTGGPGYTFEDEFDPNLRHHPYVLSMANSGPWSNGSQFFITLATTSNLNDKHAVFGNIISGTNVIDAIAAVPTDSEDRPLTNVVINTLDILRIGTQAEAFNVHAQGLPILTNLTPTMTQNPLEISYDLSHAALHSLAVSTNLTNFLPAQTQWHETTNALTTLPINTLTNSSGHHAYYAIGQIQYTTNALNPPLTLTGQNIHFTITQGAPTNDTYYFDIQFNTTNTVLASIQNNLGVFGFNTNYLVTYIYDRDLPYRGNYFQTATSVGNGLKLNLLKMAFTTSPTNGVFSTSINTIPVSGTFAPL